MDNPKKGVQLVEEENARNKGGGGERLRKRKEGEMSCQCRYVQHLATGIEVKGTEKAIWGRIQMPIEN